MTMKFQLILEPSHAPGHRDYTQGVNAEANMETNTDAHAQGTGAPKPPSW